MKYIITWIYGYQDILSKLITNHFKIPSLRSIIEDTETLRYQGCRKLYFYVFNGEMRGYDFLIENEIPSYILFHRVTLLKDYTKKDIQLEFEF